MLQNAMATRDVRKETPEAIQELRRRAVELKKQGYTHLMIADTLDVSVAASRLWWRLYREGGVDSLKLQRRGRPAGACRVLSKQQEKIVMWATDQNGISCRSKTGQIAA